MGHQVIDLLTLISCYYCTYIYNYFVTCLLINLLSRKKENQSVILLSQHWSFCLGFSFVKFLHSSHICRLDEDTAWHPVWKQEFDSSPMLRKAIIYGYGPFRPWMSIAHWYAINNRGSINVENYNVLFYPSWSLSCKFG